MTMNNHIVKLMKATTYTPTILILLLIFFLNNPFLCFAQFVDDPFATPPPTPLVSVPEVLDTGGNPVVTNASYLILPANKIDGLGKNARGVGLFSFNQTCPFHVALWSTALPLKFVPDNSFDDDEIVYETEAVKVVFDYPRMDCPEPKVWEVSSEDASQGYVMTGGEDDNADDVWFQIKRVDESSSNSVYKIQSCDNPDILGVTCKDVNVVTIQPDVMVLVIDEGVPLHVKFEKA